MEFIVSSPSIPNYLQKNKQLSKDFAQEYELLSDEFEALAALIAARKEAGLTQIDGAKKMGISQPVLARIESNLGSRKNSSTLSTLRRYALAFGKKLVISMN